MVWAAMIQHRRTKSTSTDEIRSENHSAEETPAHVLLALATKHLQQSQELTSGDISLGLQFNHGQCRYLVTNLETAVQSARDSMRLSSSKQVPVSMEDWKIMGKWKFLVRLAMDVKSFVQECCREEYWIQAASMLMNAFEHVASLSSRLELCIWSFENTNRTILGRALRRELNAISDAQDRRLRDQVSLLKKVEVALNLESLSNLQGRQLLTCVLGKLESVLDDNANLAELSVRDQFHLLMKVEAVWNSESISNQEEYQLATSLAERFIASVSDPVSGIPLKDFMRVDSESLGQAGDKELLGKGNFGEVYKVNWLGTPVAEKLLLVKDGLTDFDNEVSILARQSHPYIVRLLCYVKEEGSCSIVQELMDKDLTKLIEQRMDLHKGKTPQDQLKFPFSIDEVIDIMFQVAEGMDYLHRRKVLHRGLKSQNILVKCKKVEGVDIEIVDAKVADFGTSKTKEKIITLSHPTWNIGTSRWMAPEVINSSRECLRGEWYPEWNLFQSDVYSFGMLSYEVLVGLTPFVDDTPYAIKRKVLKGERPPLPTNYPSCLRSLIQKCWRPEPMERPSFTDICRELSFMKGSLLIGWEL